MAIFNLKPRRKRRKRDACDACDCDVCGCDPFLTYIPLLRTVPTVLHDPRRAAGHA